MLLINNAPQAKEDIPGALFTTAAFYFYLRGRTRERPRDFVLAGALIGAAIGTRYNLLPVPFLVIGVQAAAAPGADPDLERRARAELGQEAIARALAGAVTWLDPY